MTHFDKPVSTAPRKALLAACIAVFSLSLLSTHDAEAKKVKPRTVRLDQHPAVKYNLKKLRQDTKKSAGLKIRTVTDPVPKQHFGDWDKEPTTISTHKVTGLKTSKYIAVHEYNGSVLRRKAIDRATDAFEKVKRENPTMKTEDLWEQIRTIFPEIETATAPVQPFSKNKGNAQVDYKHNREGWYSHKQPQNNQVTNEVQNAYQATFNKSSEQWHQAELERIQNAMRKAKNPTLSETATASALYSIKEGLKVGAFTIPVSAAFGILIVNDR